MLKNASLVISLVIAATCYAASLVLFIRGRFIEGLTLGALGCTLSNLISLRTEK